MRVDDVRPLPAAVQELERRLGEEGEAHVLVGKAVIGAAVEEVLARMRVDEEALATVDMPEIHGAMDMVIEPGHPQIWVHDLQSPNLIVAHAIVFGQDNFDCMTANAELFGEAVYNVSEAAHLGGRRALRRNHHDKHSSSACFHCPTNTSAAQF